MKLTNLATAKENFEGLKTTVTELDEVEADKTFNVVFGEDDDTKKITIVDNGTAADAVTNGEQYATVDQAQAILDAMNAEVAENAKAADVEQLVTKLEEAINAIKDQKGTEE